MPRAKQAPSFTVDGRGLRIAILYAAFNPSVVLGLLRGARERLGHLGVASASILELEVPGAFELPLASRVAALSGRFDAIVALGAVIQGDTDHYEHVARAATEGLLWASLETSVPVAFGVLTVRDAAQAEVRSGSGPANKGAEAAAAAVAQVRALERIAGKRLRPSGKVR